MECGFIPPSKLVQLKSMYEAYTLMKGNGVRTLEIHKLEELPSHHSQIGERPDDCPKCRCHNEEDNGLLT